MDIIGRSELVRLTAGKAVANTALRWIPFFLPTLAIAFDASTEQLTTVLGVGEAAGLATILAGRSLDGGHERLIMTGAMLIVGCSAGLALIGSFPAFAVSFVVLILGVSLYTVGGHSYLSRRVSFDRRGRAIGTFETSWAIGLLVGAPVVAVLIDTFGWRGPFVAIIAASIAMTLVIATIGDTTAPPETAVEPDGPDGPDGPTQDAGRRLTGAAWRLVFASAAIAMAGLTTLVIVGTWLGERLGVSTSGVGLAAMAFGLAELSSSASSAAFSDRIGKQSSTRFALLFVLGGALIMSQAGSSLVVGVVGLLFFFLGFEYSIVTSFAILSEAMPLARGRVLATGSAVGTASRGVGTIASGVLYAQFGIRGPLALTSAAAFAALVLLADRRPTRPNWE